MTEKERLGTYIPLTDEVIRAYEDELDSLSEEERRMRIRAVAIARSEDDLAENLRNYPEGADLGNGVKIINGGNFLEMQHQWSQATLGTGYIRFVHYLDGNTALEELLGIKSQNSLRTGFHTDAETLDQALIASPEDFARLGTTFHFDLDGNYGKLVTIPEVFLDSRSDYEEKYQGEPMGPKHVKSDMTTGDFNIACLALNTLQSVFPDTTQ